MGKAAKGKEPDTEQTGARPKNPLPEQHQQRPGIEAKIDPRPQYEAPKYNGSEKLAGRAAIITGGDSGIGRSVAVLYAREGADVAIVYLPEEQRDADETKLAVESEGRRCLLIAGDVTDPKFCRDAVERAAEEFGHLDILVNNAAFQQHQDSIDKISDEQFEKTFRTNIFGYFYMAKAALKHLRKAVRSSIPARSRAWKGQRSCWIIPQQRAESMPFTKSLAQQLVEKGIRVNCVAPGPVWTPLNVVDKEPKEVAKYGADTPMKRPAQPEEIAPAFVFLLQMPTRAMSPAR